jgi:hypothetical protein
MVLKIFFLTSLNHWCRVVHARLPVMSTPICKRCNSDPLQDLLPSNVIYYIFILLRWCKRVYWSLNVSWLKGYYTLLCPNKSVVYRISFHIIKRSNAKNYGTPLSYNYFTLLMCRVLIVVGLTLVKNPRARPYYTIKIVEWSLTFL